MSDTCAACQEPLLVLLQSDSEDEEVSTSKNTAGDGDSVPDDVELTCGCHFHWYI